MDLATQQAILTEIIKGESGKVLKADLTEAKVTELQGYVGQTLDCRFDFTRQDENGDDVIEEMHCGMLHEGDDFFLVERDMLSNYDGTEVYPSIMDENGNETPGENILSTLQGKTKVALT